MSPDVITSRRRTLGVTLVVSALAAAVLAPAALSASAARADPAAPAAAPWGAVPDIPTGGHPTASSRPRPPFGAADRQHAPLARASSARLDYGGGPVMHTNRTHLIFWLPSGSGLRFDPGYTGQLQAFLARVARDSHLPTNVYGLTGQYGDGAGPAAYESTYGGAIADGDPLPPRDPACAEPAAPPADTGPGWSDCVTGAQIESELTRVVAAHRLSTGLRDIYFLVTPAGLGDCDTSTVPASCALAGASHNGYCGYHGATSRPLLYAVVPYNAVPDHCQSDSPRPNGTADPAISTLSHEHIEAITDPFGSAWTDGSGNEQADLCLDQGAHPPRTLGGRGSTRYDQVVGGGRYWIQLEWSNEDHGCAARDEWDRLALSAPHARQAGTALTLRARGRDPDGRIRSLLWRFGDGGQARGSRVRHVFRRRGRFTILVRSTDSAGNWSFASRQITITAARSRRRRRR